VPQRVESSKAGIIGHIQPGSGLKYHGLMKHVQKFWGNYPLEKRMDPVLQMDVVRSDANAVNGVNGVHVKGREQVQRTGAGKRPCKLDALT
jgi:hypothetical protein